MALGYHTCQPHIAKLYRKTPLVFNYYGQQKYYSSALIQVEAQISEYKSHFIKMLFNFEKLVLSEMDLFDIVQELNSKFKIRSPLRVAFGTPCEYK